MKGWKDISQELTETHEKFLDKFLDKSLWYHEECVSAILNELINQFKEVYEIEDDVEDDWVIKVQDIKQLIWELKK